MKPLTATQAGMLARAAQRQDGGICPGSSGNSTARALVKRGLFWKRDAGVYHITELGRAHAKETT